MSRSKIYKHTFTVVMTVDVKDPLKAEKWIDARLSGGDAWFDSKHKSVREASKKETDEYYGEPE